VLLLTDEDRNFLSRGLLPAARGLDVPDDLRGWSWSHSPLQPIYPIQLAVYEVASQYCMTGRDLYLRRVSGVRQSATAEMRRGAALHEAITAVFIAAKRRIYEDGTQVPDALRGIGVGPEALGNVAKEGLLLTRYIEELLIAEAARVVSGHPFIDRDALVARIVPAIFCVRLDGSVLGLSRHLVADAIALPWPMVIDFKFGPIEPFHRLSTTGYGLAFEATYEVPVNAGVIISFAFNNDRLLMTKDFHLLDAEVRQWFIESRDERARMLYHEHDPGLAHNHPSSCPYLATCGVSPNRKQRGEHRPVPSRQASRPATTGRIVLFPGAPATEP